MTDKQLNKLIAAILAGSIIFGYLNALNGRYFISRDKTVLYRIDTWTGTTSFSNSNEKPWVRLPE